MNSHAASQAGRVSKQLTVTARVVSSCRIRTSDVGFDPVRAQGFDFPPTSTRLTTNCSANPNGTSHMAVATESSNGRQPIVEISSADDTDNLGKLAGSIAQASSRAGIKIIHWGIHPVDVRLIVSMPTPERTAEPSELSATNQTVLLLIDY